MKFHVANVFHSNSIGLDHGSFVTVTDNVSLRIVNKGSASKGEAVREVVNKHHDFATFVSCSDFYFTRAERGHSW